MVAVRTLRFISYGVTGLGAVLVIVGGIVGWVVLPKVIESKVKDETQIVEGAFVYEKWRDLPVPIHLKAWFFNCTNYHEFVNAKDLSVMPELEEIGPFAWKENRVKYDISDGPKGTDSIYFRQNISYTFDKEASGKGLTEDMKLNLINVPFIAAMTLLDVYPIPRVLSPPVLHSMITSGESLYSEGVSVKDFVFDGVKLKPIYKTVEAAANILNIPLPFEIKNGEFAVYRAKNGTNHDGKWRVYRGTEDHTKFNVIAGIDGDETRLDQWWTDHCAMVNGTDGSMFPPLVKKDRRLHIYSSEICRSVWLDYDSEIEFENIPGYRFKMPNKLLQNPIDNPENECFFQPVKFPLDNSRNFNGIGRLFSAKDNIPIFISKPHFLDASDWIVSDGIKMGLSPKREEHDAYLDLEPNTGFPLRVHMRIQLGVEVQSFKSVNMTPYDTIPHRFYPIMWIDKTAELDEALIDELNDRLLKPLKLAKIGKWTLVGVGAFLFIAGAGYAVWKWNAS